MTSLFRNFALALLGLVFATFGVFHAVTSYPDPNVFAAVSRELPTLGAVVSFAFGITTALVGLVLLVPLVYRLRRRWQTSKVPVQPRAFTSRPVLDRRDEDV